MKAAAAAARTKVVVRRLPPAISVAAVAEQVDGRFAGLYNWFRFRPPGESRLKDQRFSRAYINFNRPEDVVEFAEFFNGHVFVNEKGVQYKAIVEYAPSQYVPKACSKKDAREGTISEDPEYLEFLNVISKPVENLPSAEIQLERKEAERAAAPKVSIIVTPLMEYIRQKRAEKAGSQRSTNGKPSRRAGVSSPRSFSPQQNSVKRRNSAPVFVLKSSMRGGNGKDRSAYVLLSRRDTRQHIDKSLCVSTNGKGTLEAVASGNSQNGKKRVLLVKSTERESSQDQPHEAKDACKSQLHMTPSPELQTQPVNLDKNNRPPRRPNPRILLKGHQVKHSTESDAKRPSDSRNIRNDIHGSSVSEKFDKRTRTKERVDRVWAPLHRLGGSNKHAQYTVKEMDNSIKGGGFGGHGTYERKVWVQKSSSVS